MENNSTGPEKISTDISRPKDNSYESFLKKQEKIAEAIRGIIDNDSEKIIRDKIDRERAIECARMEKEGTDPGIAEQEAERMHPYLPGYTVTHVDYPKEEEVMYDGEPLYERFEEVVKAKNPPAKEMLLKMGEYVRALDFMDDAVGVESDYRRRAIEEHLAKDHKELYKIYDNNKLRGSKVTGALSLLLYPADIFGKEFVVDERMKHLAEKLRREVSEDTTSTVSVDRKQYDKLSSIMKRAVIVLATQLVHDICVKYIKTYGTETSA